MKIYPSSIKNQASSIVSPKKGLSSVPCPLYPEPCNLEFGHMNHAIDDEILNILIEEGIDLICSVPCIMLAGVLKKLENTSITHIPVTREEEGVGLAAGVSLGGKKPALIMQNSGLGNSINALLSLTKLYGLPLPLIISQRGGKGEKVLAQMPMGKATTNLLKAARIDYVRIKKREDFIKMRKMIRRAFGNNRVTAIILLRKLWDEAH